MYESVQAKMTGCVDGDGGGGGGYPVHALLGRGLGCFPGFKLGTGGAPRGPIDKNRMGDQCCKRQEPGGGGGNVLTRVIKFLLESLPSYSYLLSSLHITTSKHTRTCFPNYTYLHPNLHVLNF